MEIQLERLAGHVASPGKNSRGISQQLMTHEPVKPHVMNSEDLVNNTALDQNIHNFPPLIIQTRVLLKRPFDEGCHCSCHQPKYLQSPNMVQKIIGNLFIGYTGPTLVFGSCNDSRCRQESSASARLTYIFPYWFWQRAICVAFSFNNGAGPELVIRVPYVRPISADWFRCARCGDVEGLKNLLKSGKASGKLIYLVVSYMDRLG